MKSGDTILRNLQAQVTSGDYRISDHADMRLEKAGLRTDEVVKGIAQAQVVEAYPTFAKGPCVLVLQIDDDHVPYHALWGTPRGHDSPAVLITAYRPEPELWSPGLRSRRRPAVED